MDPYLENHWLDVHTKLVAYAADELNRVLPESLVARTEERVAVESDWGGQRVMGPDVRVFSPPRRDTGNEGGQVIDAPFKLVLELDPITERFVRILDRGGRLITVIEFISPTNKTSGLEDYREKRRELLSAGVNLVEIDLTRQGSWRALMRPHFCPTEGIAEYRTTIRTAPGTAYLFPMPLRSRLPDIPIPLRSGDPPTSLPLQQLIDQVHQNGRYSATIDYTEPCDPPLTGDDVKWAQELRNIQP
jgi:hypothetical protein